jgi:hypothetical protein
VQTGAVWIYEIGIGSSVQFFLKESALRREAYRATQREKRIAAEMKFAHTVFGTSDVRRKKKGSSRFSNLFAF